MADDVDVDPAIVNAPVADDFALGSTDQAPPKPIMPPWLNGPMPKKAPFNWPGGAKSPSWFKQISTCPRKHAQKYRKHRPDPSGLDAKVGSVIHGALEDAANIRRHPGRHRGIPAKVSPEELLCLLEHQEEVILGEGTEVLARARETVRNMKPVDLSNLWGVEYIWSFMITENLKAAGIADLVQTFPDMRNPNGPPLMVVVTDYKTGAAQLPSKAELELDAQCQLELAWARRQWPNTPRIRFRILNVAHNQEIWLDWSQGNEELVLGFARACWNIWQRGTETPNVGDHCKYCPFRADCTGRGSYQEFVRSAASAPQVGLDHMPLEDLIAEYYQARLVSDLADERRKDAGQRILPLMGGTRQYRTPRHVAYKKSKRMPHFRSEADLILQLADLAGAPMHEILDRFVTIRKKELDAWLKALPPEKQAAANAMVEQNLSLNETPPWIEVREQEPIW